MMPTRPFLPCCALPKDRVGAGVARDVGVEKSLSLNGIRTPRYLSRLPTRGRMGRRTLTRAMMRLFHAVGEVGAGAVQSRHPNKVPVPTSNLGLALGSLTPLGVLLGRRSTTMHGSPPARPLAGRDHSRT